MNLFLTRGRKIFLSVTAIWMLLSSGCQPVSLPIPQESTRLPTLAAAVSTQIPIPTRTSIPLINVDANSMEGTRITFWHPWAGAEDIAVNNMVSEFNKSNIWGIQVTLMSQGSTLFLREKIENNAEHINLPDVIAAPIEDIRAFNSEQKIILNLADYIQDDTWGFSANEIEKFNPVYWQQDIFEGSHLGIPAIRSAAIIVYNDTWAGELNYKDPPLTVVDFKRQACSAAGYDPADEGVGGYILDTSHPSLINWLYSFDPEAPSRVASGETTFNNDSTTKTVSYLRDLVDSGCAWSSISAEPHDYFARRQALSYSGSLEDIVTQTNANKRLSSEDKWSVIPYPSSHGNQTLLVNGLSYSILESTPQRQLASWLFIRWLSLPHNHAQLVQASGTLPVMKSEMKMLGYYSRRYPQWAELVNNLPEITPEPTTPEWRTVRIILSDGVWQSLQYYVGPSEIPSLLKEMDATIAEVLSRKKE